jgi:hypothetical protein
MASFSLNRKELDYLKKAESGLLSFYKDPWMELDLSESLKAIKILLNEKSKPENKPYLEEINSLIKKVGV